MKLEFAKYYDITAVAKAHNADYNQYEKIFVCVDTNNFWIARVLKGYTNDENNGYEPNENGVILERNKIDKQTKASGIERHSQLIKVLNDDDMGNWDCENIDTVEQAVEMLDDGFGIGVYEN